MMKLEIRSPFKIHRDTVDKTVSLPSVIKLRDGTLFSTWFPEYSTSGTYDTRDIQGQMNAYSRCSPVNSIVNKQCDALKNGRFIFVDDKGNEKLSGNSYLDKLMIRANPLQTWKQFIGTAYAFMKIHGIAYCLPVYGALRNEPRSLYVIPNFMVTPVYSKKIYQQTELTDIITGYKITGISQMIDPNDLLIFQDGGVSVDTMFERMMIPQSRMVAIKDSINSIIASTDAWLTIAQRKGLPLGIISSGGKDATSTIPLTPEQKDEVHQELNTNYGLSGNAKKFIITAASLNFQSISVPTKDLMIMEGVEAHTRMICNAYSYPFRLMEYDSGSSLSNGGEVKEARKMMYQELIIPDAEFICERITEFFELKGVTLKVYFDHLEIFQKSKEETARALMSLTAGLDRPYMKQVITLEEYRTALSELLNIDPDKPNGKTYYTAPASPNATGESGTA